MPCTRDSNVLDLMGPNITARALRAFRVIMRHASDDRFIAIIFNKRRRPLAVKRIGALALSHGADTVSRLLRIV